MFIILSSLLLFYIEKKLVPGLTTAHQSLADEMTSVMESSRNSRGLAIIIDTDTSLMHHGSSFSQTFKDLSFSIFRHIAVTKKEVAGVLLGAAQIKIGSSAGQRTDYPIVVVLTAKVCKGAYNIMLRCLDGKIHICQEVVKPLLPPNAPNLSNSPKIFFINASSPEGYILPLRSLNLPLQGNFLVSLMAMEDSKLKEILSKLQRTLTSSKGSIKDILYSIGDYQSMKLIDHLDKPVSLCHQRLYTEDDKFLGVEAEQFQSCSGLPSESFLDDESCYQLQQIYDEDSYLSESHPGRYHHEYDDSVTPSIMFRTRDSE